MQGSRNNISSTAGIQGYRGGGGGRQGQSGQQHMNHVGSNAAMMGATPTSYSPQSLYTPHQIDQYRHSTNASASMNLDPFPSTPYTPVSALFMSPTVSTALATPSVVRQQRAVTQVSASKFNVYTTIYNLEEAPSPCAIKPSILTQAYQTTTRYLGKEICLRRLVNAPYKDECARVLEQVRQHRHPNLVPLSNLYATDEFIMGSNDIIMEYRYIPGAKNLHDAFLVDGARATEGLLWSFTCQLIGLLRSFHENMLPLRGLHFSKIIYVEATGRFYFTGLGLADLVDPRPMNITLFKEDIHALGLILYQLAARNANLRADQFDPSQPIVGFSQSFIELIKICLESTADLAQLCHALGERMSMEVGHQEGHADFIFSECNKEVHNGRLMRLMIKFNFVLEYINQVQEYQADVPYYALRLFHQFMFNQVDEANRIHCDWGHVYHCLNKLDCGSEEFVQLISTENPMVLVTSYADLRATLDQVFDQLHQAVHSSSRETDAMMFSSPGSI